VGRRHGSSSFVKSTSILKNLLKVWSFWLFPFLFPPPPPQIMVTFWRPWAGDCKVEDSTLFFALACPGAPSCLLINSYISSFPFLFFNPNTISIMKAFFTARWIWKPYLDWWTSILFIVGATIFCTHFELYGLHCGIKTSLHCTVRGECLIFVIDQLKYTVNAIWFVCNWKIKNLKKKKTFEKETFISY